MKPFRSSLTLLGAALAFARLTAAVDPASVASDARWVVHADFNALRASTLGKELIATAEKAQTEATQGMIGLDVGKVLATIGSATAYGANFSKDPHAIDGTLILRGTPDLRKILESFLLQGTLATEPFVTELDASEQKELSFPAYRLHDPKQPDKNGVFVAFPREPVVLVSKSKSQLVKARDVLRGSAPSLARTSDSPLRKLLPRDGNEPYLFCASTVPTDEFFTGDAPQARILKMAESFSVGLGETGPNTFAHVELVATSDVMADKLLKIVQGMTAMLSLAESSDRHLAEFLNSTSVTREDDTVTLHLAYASERLVQMARSFHQFQNRPERPRGPQITSGRVIEEWTATAAPDQPNFPASRTIENVELKNGSAISVGRNLNGGRAVRFTRVEITPAHGGAPLVFRSDMMRNFGPRAQFQFPGADGTYTVKVDYINDADGKAKYALSVREPAPAKNESGDESK